jgi:hypothetical protein
MSEELLVTARDNALIDPSLHIWTWEVAMYLWDHVFRRLDDGS